MVTRKGRLGCRSAGGRGQAARGEIGAQTLGEAVGGTDGGLGQEQREGAAGPAADEVDRARAGDERLRHLRQREVAGGAAEAIVEAAQIVEVDEQQRERAVVAAGAVELLGEARCGSSASRARR